MKSLKRQYVFQSYCYDFEKMTNNQKTKLTNMLVIEIHNQLYREFNEFNVERYNIISTQISKFTKTSVDLSIIIQYRDADKDDVLSVMDRLKHLETEIRRGDNYLIINDVT